MTILVAALALAVAVLYAFIGVYIVPRLARLAERTSAWLRAAEYGAAAFFFGCALTHVAIAVHTLAEPPSAGGHALTHLTPHAAQVLGGALFAGITWKKLDVRVRTKEEARLEEESAALRDQLERSQRLSSLGQMAGGVAHDFNNLLSVVLGFTRLVDERLVDRPDLRADLAEVLAAVERGQDLAQQMLLAGRGSETESGSVDVNRAILGSRMLLQQAVGQRVELRLTLERDVGSIPLSRGRLEQILLNLAINARDAMPNGGTLEIATARSDASGSPRARVAVSDHGSGMAADVVDRIFEPFFSTKPEGQGTGLGLAMVYGIIDRAGGTIDVLSAPGEGTRFTIDLPVVNAGAPEPLPDDERAGELDGVTVLVVDDQPALRMLVRRILADRGARVIEAADGDDAQARFAEHRDEIDLVLTDLIMPGMSGADLVGRLRVERPTLPVVYLSGYSGNGADVANDGPLVAKPFESGALVQAITDALSARTLR